MSQIKYIGHEREELSIMLLCILPRFPGISSLPSVWRYSKLVYQ
jgi:hypothetical protein